MSNELNSAKESRRIFQVLYALNYGDGVSNDVIKKHRLLQSMGYESYIYCRWKDSRVASLCSDIRAMQPRKNDILIHHFSGPSVITEYVQAADCVKVLQYHNVTPPRFFSDSAAGLSDGEKQLQEIKGLYDYFLCVSEFNANDLRRLGVATKIDILPIIMDFDAIRSAPFHDLRASDGEIIFLFTGRFAANKRQEDVIDIFDFYYNHINKNSFLYLVGNVAEYPERAHMLRTKLETLRCNSHVIFTGKVTDAELYNYYKNADAFICMSEHEGFCIPLLESMAAGAVTMAYNACAVAETMRGAGILTDTKAPEALARCLHIALTDNEIREAIRQKQFAVVESYSLAQARKTLEKLIAKWTEKSHE